MAYIKLDLDNETFTRLMDVALQERRPIPWQAEVLLRHALGLPFPIPHDGEQRMNAAEHVRMDHTHA
jgi:hypothetical protein